MAIRRFESWLRHLGPSILLGLVFGFVAWAPAVNAQDKPVGGHVGIAFPLVTLADPVTSISDQFTILTPIGIGFKTSERVIVDLETVVVSPVDPARVTGLVVDPGLI